MQTGFLNTQQGLVLNGSAAWCFTCQYVMGMFSCHHTFPFALAAAVSHCVAGGRVTQPSLLSNICVVASFSLHPQTVQPSTLQPFPLGKVREDSSGRVPSGFEEACSALKPPSL